MISEREFAVNFSNFWRGTLPNLEAVTRSLNFGSTTVWPEVVSVTNPARRDIISETAFNLSARFFQKDAINETDKIESEELSKYRISQLRRGDDAGDPEPLNKIEWQEVLTASKRIIEFCKRFPYSTATFNPSFRGHGFVHGCEGDILIGDNIVEIKYVARNFRSTDIKQVLVYLFLSVLSKQENIKNIIVLNPFRGTYIGETASQLINAAGGISVLDLATHFSECVASGELSR